MNKSTRFLIPILLAGLCLLALLTGLGGKAYAEPQVWTTAAPIPYTWLGPSVQCPDDPNHFYLIGGVTTGLVDLDSVSRYDVQTGNWDSLDPLPLPNRGSNLTCYEGKIYAVGGLSRVITDTLFIYDIISDTWTAGAPLPTVIVGASLGAWDGKLYLAGGNATGAPWVPLNDVHIYDIATDTWTPNGGTSMPVASNFGDYIQAGPYLYIVGGLSGNYDQNITATQRYDMSSDQWEQGPAFTGERALTGLAINQQYLYAIGGDANGGGDWTDATNYVERLDFTVWPGGSWTDVSDPLPVAVLSPGGFCSEALAGGEIWAVGGGMTIDQNLYRPAEPCLGNNYSLALNPGGLLGEGQAGEIVEYTLTITNTGDTPDAYTIDVTATWTTTVSMMVGAFDPGESRPVTVTVEVPDGAGLGDSDTATITLTSQGDPAQEASATVTTSAGTPYGVALTPALVELSGLPGVTVTYTLHLSNTGEVTDTYTLAYTGNQWTVQLPVTQTTLMAGESLDVTAYVFVPADATDGEMDTVTVTATSQGEPQVSAGSELTTTAVWWKNFLPVISKS